MSASLVAKQVISRLAILLVALSLAAMAQESCAISGRVVDDTGKPVPSAFVKALRERFLRDEFVVAGSEANQRGDYCIRDLAAGDYLVRATARVQPLRQRPRDAIHVVVQLQSSRPRSIALLGRRGLLHHYLLGRVETDPAWTFGCVACPLTVSEVKYETPRDPL